MDNSVVGSKKRKNNSCPSSFSSSYPFPAVDVHKRNGNSNHTTLQGSSGAAATSVRKSGLGHGGSGLWSGGADWLSKFEGSQSHNSQNRWVQPALFKEKKATEAYVVTPDFKNY